MTALIRMRNSQPTLLSGHTGIGAPFAVYTIDPKCWGQKGAAKRFLGCAFPVSSDGLLATCAHVIPDIDPHVEMIVVQHPLESICHKVSTPILHRKHDFALIKIDAKTPHWPAPIRDELMLATDVFAYGYYDNQIEKGDLVIIPQVYAGIITATPRRFKMPLATALPFYQLDFPALVGFSGTALFAKVDHENHALAGMIFGNVSSEVVERFITESVDLDSKVIEKTSRIWESGVAHTAMAMAEFSKEMGCKIWS